MPDDGDGGSDFLDTLMPTLPAGPTLLQPFHIAPGTSTEDIFTQLRDLGLQQQFPARLGAILSAIMRLQGMAGGSPQALLGAAGPQLGQLGGNFQRMLAQISRLLGPGGGGQIDLQQRQAGAQLQGQTANLFSGLPLQAQQLLARIAGGTSLIGGMPRTATATGPLQFPLGAGDFAGLGALSKMLSGAFGGSSPTVLSGGGFENLA